MELREGSPREAGVDAHRVQCIRDQARTWVDGGVHQALVLLAARRGVIFLHEAYGKLTPAPDAPDVVPDTLFPLMSATKPITATAVMQLVEDGRIGLTRPVQDYLPEFTGKGKDDVLVHHLLTHTSGLHNADVAAFVAAQEAIAPPAAAPLPHPTIRALGSLTTAAVPLWRRPGEEMSYCLMNYILLGELVGRVSGRPLQTWVQDRIFTPLGMRDTHGIFPATLAPRRVQRPLTAPAAYWTEDPLFHSFGHGSGGGWSTAQDLAVFGQTFLNGGSCNGARILSAATVREMTRNQIPGISTSLFGEWHREAGWGYGWGVHVGEPWRYFPSLWSAGTFHHGGAGGMLLWVDPAAEVVGVYCSVALRFRAGGVVDWRADAFQAMVAAAVE